ncbi:hypothetical protein BKA65DRAFT_532668 [Rhexocercosporidium sp. MPI-PUGE-AT-0058]|nr:hypothetical protein BKA65DRAFT_532668 [Rhexocercosporidium sp. MPI-PUGE-AT-0058]
MQQAQAAAEDSRRDTERRLICKGSALVRFEFLRWNEYVKRNEAKRRPDQAHVERVKRIFRKAGCRPLEITHHIPAVVSQQQLDAALEDARRRGWKAGILPSNYATINTPDGYPELEFPGGIECLHGLHRIQAGKEWLQPTEKWWIVDIYLSGISYELSTILNEEYTNAEDPCDGEIYRKIREYHFLPSKADSQISAATCVSFEMIWWARLNKSREKKLRTLFGKCERTRRLAASFDTLSKIAGLFDAGMMVTTLNKVMATKCYEEICHYNQEHIFKVWVGFMKGIGNGFQRIDKTTVKTVEKRAPGVSTSDARFLQGRVLGGAIFGDFTRQEREAIWQNILEFRGIIPSLSTFFKDVHLLQACVNSISWLVTVARDQTVFSALAEAYTQRDTQLVQTSATTVRFETGSRSYCLRLAYLGLFAIAMRDNKDLPKAPTENDLKEMPRAKADHEVLRRFATDAYMLGFESDKIKTLKGDSGHHSLEDAPGTIPITVTTGPGEDIKQRCGLPSAKTFREDKNYLYLDNLYREQDETGEGITSFFVLRSWFVAFFGPWPRPSSSTESRHRRRFVEDVSMGEELPDLPDQRESGEEEPFIQEPKTEMLDIDVEMQEIATQQRGVEPSVEAGGITQEEDTLFVPTEPITEIGAEAAGNTIIIRFLEVDSNESETLNLLPDDAKIVLEIKVEYGDPTSLVAQHATNFFNMGKRTCDRGKRYVPPRECYNVATSEGNKNTIFLMPDVKSQAHGQPSDPAEEGSQGRPKEYTQERQKQPHGVEVLEDWDFEAVLASEQDNAANAQILGSENTMIHLKRRLGDSNDVSKPAEAWEWQEIDSIDVHFGDPQGIVLWKMRQIWKEAHLKPHDKTLRVLDFGDCYKVAADDDDHTLYMMAPSSQTEAERAAEHSWKPPSPLPVGSFDLPNKPGRRVIHVTPHVQKDVGFRSSKFVPPPDTEQLALVKPGKRVIHGTPHVQKDVGFSSPKFVPPPDTEQLPLVEASAEDHRDKIGMKLGAKKNGLRFVVGESPEIRKRPDSVRQMQPPDQAKGSNGRRKLLNPRNHKNRTTPDAEMIEEEIS